jgi:Zn-dependent M28 family amino/carboxypeptidase
LFPDLLRSDHAPFWDKGVPAVFVSDTANFRNPNYHQPGDTVDTIDLAFFKGSAQHVVNAIAALINQTG